MESLTIQTTIPSDKITTNRNRRTHKIQHRRTTNNKGAEKVIKKLKNNKSLGEDTIQAELIKAARWTTPWIHKIVVDI